MPRRLAQLFPQTPPFQQLHGVVVANTRMETEVVDPNDIQMLTDLFHAAIADALFKIKEKLREEMSTLTGGMGLPPGMLGM